MSTVHKNWILICVSLAAAGFFSLGAAFKDLGAKDTVRVSAFPKHFGGWNLLEEIPLSASDKKILETDNAFIRKYADKTGQAVYLYIVYSQGNRKVSHPPEICYTGNGVSIIKKTLLKIGEGKNAVPANVLLLHSGQAYQYAFYWFKSGDAFTASYWKQQALVALGDLLGKRTGSALVRVSVDLNGDRQEALDRAGAFISAAKPLLMQYLP